MKIFDNKNNSKEYFFDVEVTKKWGRKHFKKLFWKRKEDENLKVKKSQKLENNFNISWNNDRNILINKTFDFPLLWRFIHNEKYYVNIDELWNFQQSSLMIGLDATNLNFMKKMMNEI